MANRIETGLLIKGLTGDTYALDVRGNSFVNGDIEINGNVNIVGTATTINTQTVQARDNKIELNYSGSTSSAIGGGIEILSGRTDGSSVSLTIDVDRDWNSNTGLNITGRTSDSTTNGLKVQNSGGTDNFVVRNDGNVGIGTSTPSEKLHVSGNTKITGGLNIGTIGSGSPSINLGLDSSGNVVTGTTSSVNKYSTTLTSPTTGNYIITHNLGTDDISVTLWLVISDEMTSANINTRTSNSVTISFLSDVGEDVRVVVIG